MKRHGYLLSLGLWAGCTAFAQLPPRGLVLDLDAARGVELADGQRVKAWENQAAGAPARRFVQQDQGRGQSGEGRPTLRPEVPELKGRPALVFRQQELVCADEDAFDGLSTGKGHTWIIVLAVHPQRVGLKDVNAFFGNLRNGQNCEGVWGCLDDDNRLWWGVRNGITFGRFDGNNPKIAGPVLAPGRFHLVAGRMAAGQAKAKLELFVDGVQPVASGEVPVNPKADPSKLVIGQERDAVEHPGRESFDGEIARLLIWERPLGDEELKTVVAELMERFGLGQ